MHEAVGPPEAGGGREELLSHRPPCAHPSANVLSGHSSACPFTVPVEFKRDPTQAHTLV